MTVAPEDVTSGTVTPEIKGGVVSAPQAGAVSVPNQSGHIYLITNRQGQYRLIIVTRPDYTKVQMFLNQNFVPGFTNSDGAVVITPDSDVMGALNAAMALVTASATLKIYSGAQPATTLASETGTLGATLTFGSTPFGAGSTGTSDGNITSTAGTIAIAAEISATDSG